MVDIYWFAPHSSIITHIFAVEDAQKRGFSFYFSFPCGWALGFAVGCQRAIEQYLSARPQRRGAAARRDARVSPSPARRCFQQRQVVWGSPHENPGQQPKNCGGGLVGCFGPDATRLSGCVRRPRACRRQSAEALTCTWWFGVRHAKTLGSDPRTLRTRRWFGRMFRV